MNILLACFSATENTARIARALQGRLEELGAHVDPLDVTTPDGRRTPPDMNAYDAAVFGSPIHYMRAPRVVRQWLAGVKGRGKPCALFFTYGGFQVHPAHAASAEIVRGSGFDLVASAEFPARHTYNLLGWRAMADRPGEAEIETAREYADLILARFSGRDPDRVGELPQGPHSREKLDEMEVFVPSRFPSRPGRDQEDCQMCMLCEELCPTGAMDAETGRADAESCMVCLRCVQVCPDEVVTFLDLSDLFAMKMDMDRETPESLRRKQSRIYR